MSNKQNKRRLAEIAASRAFQAEAPKEERRVIHRSGLTQEFVGMGTRFLKFSKPDAQGRKGIVVKFRKFANEAPSHSTVKTFHHNTVEVETGFGERPGYSWNNEKM